VVAVEQITMVPLELMEDQVVVEVEMVVNLVEQVIYLQ